MDTVACDDLNLFKNPARILICGSSGAGKSILLSRLINKYCKQFEKIIISSASTFPETGCSNVINYDGVYDPLSEENKVPYQQLIIYDDLLLADNKEQSIIASAFTRGRHVGASICFVTQNLFHCNKYYRSIALNSNYVILCRMRDVGQISVFARSFLEKDKIVKFVNVYKKYVLSKPYGYLLIDFTALYNSKLMIRTNIADESYEKIIELK